MIGGCRTPIGSSDRTCSGLAVDEVTSRGGPGRVRSSAVSLSQVAAAEALVGGEGGWM